jgi:ubiquitin-protein ligase
MANTLAIQRLIREKEKMQASPNSSFIAVPSSDNIFEWHFLLRNFNDEPYINGQYHGKLIIPVEYPMKPPTLYFITP